MKLINAPLLTVMNLLPAIALGAAIESVVPVDHVYSPAGFDSNDNSEIVITGYLPNLCYKAPSSSVEIKNGKINVSVKAMRRIEGFSYCPNVIIPYFDFINLGVLDKGKYQVVVNEKSQWEKKSILQIAEARSNSMDEEIYANVEEVVKEEGSRKVLLKGYNPSDCFELKEIIIKDNEIDTYSILPKMKQIRAHCPKKMVPFVYEVEVPEKLEADRVLLHVRVMDGRSVNSFYNNKPLEVD